MKGQYDYKFQNFDSEEKKDSRSRIDSTSLQIKTSVDQDSTKPFTEATQRKRNRRFNTLKSLTTASLINDEP